MVGPFWMLAHTPISAVTALFPNSDPYVLFAEIITAPGSPVDSAGRAVLRCEGDVRATLEWGINCAYRNDIDCWGSEGSVVTERVFSKPADYTPRFRFLDRHGNESYVSGESENHFLAMLKSFRSLVDDPTRAEHERVLIARRARLVDAVRQQSTQ